MMRSKKLITLVVVALGALVAIPAFADGNEGGGKGPRLSFPVPAATFKQHVDARQAKMRDHVEKRASTLPADQAKEMRAKFEASVLKVNAEVAKVIADGTVTKDEADAVRAASPRGGKGGPGGGGHCDKNKK